MSGLGLFTILFGVITAWSGYEGMSAVDVFRSAITGGTLPPHTPGKGFSDLAQGFTGALSGIGQAVVSAGGNAIKGTAGDLTGLKGTPLLPGKKKAKATPPATTGTAGP